MTTYWNDLKALEDLTEKITAPIEEPYNDHDIEQFKESVQYFIEDFIKNMDSVIKIFVYQMNIMILQIAI